MNVGRGSGSQTPHAALQLSPSRSGVALIITLILLSVTLLMALAFLAISRRESSSVTTQTAQMTAQQAADSALAAAEAQIAANILATTNPYNFGLLVSTNYINAYGFQPGLMNPTNVNYDYTFKGATLTLNDFLQNLNNLLYAPRPPVFIPNPTNPAQPPDFRYYLDLNRNGVFDDSGLVPNVELVGGQFVTNGFIAEQGDPQWVGVLEHPDQPYGPNNRFLARWAFIALPSANALDLNYIHNQALAPRSGNTSLNYSPDDYFRNQGVGTWELNLAAFLADLNTNQWGAVVGPPGAYYQYNQPGNPNVGIAFNDALSLLRWRYGFTYNSLASANALFANPLNYPFNVDLYGDGPLQITVDTNFSVLDRDNPTRPWAGADNTNRFFDLPSELFDATKSSPAFVQRLGNAGTGFDTYDRYTFYRLLAQMGADSSPESGKINLNYSNAVVTYANVGGVSVPTNITVVPGAETNLVPWAPQNFFLAAADKMLRFYTTRWFEADPTNYLWTYYGIPPDTNYYIAPNGFGLTNRLGLPNALGLTRDQVPSFGVTDIPVWVNTNFVYRPAVNRLLQLAANLYDASTNSFYPDVFRPIFEHDNFGNVFIVGYTNLYSDAGPNTVSGTADPQLSAPYDPTLLPLSSSFTPIRDTYGLVNVYGVPWIIGAKKGFPNFNKFGSENIVQITRKLQVARKQVANGTPLTPDELAFTNQLYAFSISNSLGVECWNSYSNNYPNPVYIHAQDLISMWITNDYGAPAQGFSSYPVTRDLTVSPSWPGYTNGYAASFQIPINNQATILFSNFDWYFGTSPPGVKGFWPDSYNYGWETNRTGFDLPQFGLLTTNRFQLYILDSSNGVYHVIDYVHLAGPDTSRNLNAAFQTNDTRLSYDNMWSTTLDKPGLPYGIKNQWDVSIGAIPLNASYWRNPPTSTSKATDEIIGFCEFLGLSPPTGYKVTDQNVVKNYTSRMIVQVPYTPTATIYDYTGWQANDPLVHYLAGDLTYNGAENGGNLETGIHKLPDNQNLPAGPIYYPLTVNPRYQPWGSAVPIAFSGSGYNFGSVNFNLVYEDPLVWGSDFWDFPTNKYPGVGWIGRVHRGTPWQTVYLKAHNVLHVLGGGMVPNLASGTNTWQTWTGDYNTFDAAHSAPLQDRLLFDLFTTAPNDNAARGQLSVNQTHLAAWSALFSGMVALTNTTFVPAFAPPSYRLTPTYAPTIIQPAGADGLNSALGNLVTNINYARSVFTNADGTVGVFAHKGDILSVAALTEQSPFLNRTGWQMTNGISDQVYEWLPQQMMSLVDCPAAPSYTIYAYGQGLQPAPGGTYLGSGPYFGMVTNYQVVSETAIRAKVRFDTAVTNLVTTVISNGVPTLISQPAVTPPSAVIENYTVLPPD